MKRYILFLIVAVLLAAQSSLYTQSAGVELTVTTPFLNVREGPSIGNAIIGQLTCGQKVMADAKTADGTWHRINYNGQSGFVFAQFAVPGGSCQSGAPTTAPAPAGINVTVTSDLLNVRSGPSLNEAILGWLRRGDVVQATARTADGLWLQILYNNRPAFVFAQYTTFGGASTGLAPAPALRPSGNWIFELGGHIGSTTVFNQMRDIGMTWVKFQTQDTDIPGRIAAAKAAGLKVLIGAVGERARAADPNYHREFAAYLADLVRQGADAIEVWNEPNLDREYGALVMVK